MKDVASQYSVILTNEQTSEFNNLIKDFVDIANDPVYYRLATLIALTKPPTDGSENVLAPLKTYYELLLRRRTEWMFRKGGDVGGGGVGVGVVVGDRLRLRSRDPETMITRVFACIKNMERLAEILLYIKNQH